MSGPRSTRCRRPRRTYRSSIRRPISSASGCRRRVARCWPTARRKIPHPGVSIYRAWRTQVQHDTFDDELGSHTRLPDFEEERVSDNADTSGDLFSIDALFLRALAYPAATFPTSRDYFRDVVNATNPGRDA